MKIAININIKNKQTNNNTGNTVLLFDKIQICLYIYLITLVIGMNMKNQGQTNQPLNKRELIAIEALKILLPEVQSNSLFRKAVTYDSMARDAVYTADAMIKALEEDL